MATVKVPRHDKCEILGRSRKHRYMLALTQALKMMVEKMEKPYPKRAASIGDDAPGDQLGEGGSTPTAALQ